MDRKRNELLSMIRGMLETENRYLTSDIDRNILTETLRSLRTEYEKTFISHKFPDSSHYKSMILLVLERLKQTILFEDKLVHMVEDLYESFNKRFEELMNEPISLDQPESCSDTSEIPEIPTQPKKSVRRANYPHKVTQILKKWLEDNVNHPYPSEAQKIYFCEKTGLDISQINNWFINARRRILPLLKYKNPDE
jgi:homeobox protein TGIF1